MTNTTTAVPTTGLILAIDLGEYKSGACDSRSADEARFTTVPTTRQILGRLLDKHRPSLVLIEACLLAGWGRDLCVETGVTCLVANTSSEAWEFKRLKRQTDRDDALRLAEIYRLGQVPAVHLPEKVVREKRGLIETRQKLVGRLVTVQNRIRAVLLCQRLPAPVGFRPLVVIRCRK